MGLLVLILFAIFWFFCSSKFEKGNPHDTLIIWGVMLLIVIVVAIFASCVGAL